MAARKINDGMIERWRIEPRATDLEFDESTVSEPAPPLWRDLTVASAVAVLLWLAAAIVFG